MASGAGSMCEGTSADELSGQVKVKMQERELKRARRSSKVMTGSAGRRSTMTPTRTRMVSTSGAG